ncbi:MAG: hypothetical protein KGL31_14010 [candidate division NC10 bacterium]|nr:hypothetical protein [candidate division NC10 bacterium]MDE2322993.1 hypothetical protein [candidate division NC10 bacterium]
MSVHALYPIRRNAAHGVIGRGVPSGSSRGSVPAIGLTCDSFQVTAFL